MTRIAVIGGGIAGLSAAAALAPHGEVVVLERESALGYHASGRSAAMFVENYGNAVVCALNRASRPVLEARGVLSARGVMEVALAADEERFERDLEAFGMEEIPLAEARARVPILSDGIRRAGYYADALDIDTDRLVQGFAADARKHGARILTGAEVTGIASGRAWRVAAGGREIEADVLVNAAGAWADRIAGMAGARPVGLQPYRRSMARLPAPGGHDTRDWPMLMGPGEEWYAKPDAGGWIVSPAEEHPCKPMDAWADDLVLAEGLARYEPYVSEPVRRVETNWAGLRTFASDRALVIGEAPDAAGFFWMAGQGGYGFQTAPAAAALLAAAVTGQPPTCFAGPSGAVAFARAVRLTRQAKSGV